MMLASPMGQRLAASKCCLVTIYTRDMTPQNRGVENGNPALQHPSFGSPKFDKLPPNPTLFDIFCKNCATARLCLGRGQATDFGVKGVQTVILAEPTRQPSSLKYLQHLLQNVWRDKFHRRRWLIEVLDGNGRDSTVQNRMKAYSDHLSALTEPGHILSPLSRTSPQLLDLCGRSFPLLRSNLRSLLRAQGRAEEPRWLQSLYAWLLEHQRKPRRHVDLEESLQAERLNRGYRYVRQKLFNKKLGKEWRTGWQFPVFLCLSKLR